MSPVLFLDFDDVLAIHQEHNSRKVLDAFRTNQVDEAHELWDSIFDRELRQNLQSLHDEFEPEYVISSSWADYLSQDQIRDVLHRTGISFVAKNLHSEWRIPHLKRPDRLADIEAWLHLNNTASMRPFVIIDDIISGYELRGSRLESQTVMCDARTGFTKPKLELALKILRGQFVPPRDQNA